MIIVFVQLSTCQDRNSIMHIRDALVLQSNLQVAIVNRTVIKNMKTGEVNEMCYTIGILIAENRLDGTGRLAALTPCFREHGNHQ